MERREAIKRTAMLMGGVIFAPNILGVLKGCSPAAENGTSAGVFTNAQTDLATSLANTIIPAGDTPGAEDVGVPGFIESMVSDIYTEEQREMFLDGLEEFDRICREETDSSFTDLSGEDQFEFASAQNRMAVEGEEGGNGQFFLIFKELTLIGFFTSEAGATQVLQYEEVPGSYNGCMPLEEVGKTWAT